MLRGQEYDRRSHEVCPPNPLRQWFIKYLACIFNQGREVPRIHGKLGLPLPNARLVSKVIHPDIRTSTPFTVFVMQWGQLMDHDMVSTPLPVGKFIDERNEEIKRWGYIFFNCSFLYFSFFFLFSLSLTYPLYTCTRLYVLHTEQFFCTIKQFA